MLTTFMWLFQILQTLHSRPTYCSPDPRFVLSGLDNLNLEVEEFASARSLYGFPSLSAQDSL
jgi:hypothetical protein